jgi:tetratricopeptide (TPR) repeat protein
MFMYRRLVKAGLVLLTTLVTCAACRAASCIGPDALEAKVHANPSATAYGELGQWFQQQNQSSCAIDAYRAAFKADPRSRAALHALAQSLIASGDYTSAIDLLRTSPHDEESTLDLASAYSGAGRLDDAFQTLTRALRTNPSSARLTGALVVVLANHGQLDDAYRLSEKFAASHPHDPEAQKLLLRVLVATNGADAQPLAHKLLAASPHDSELLYLSGVLERKAGEFAPARGHLEKAIALTPNYAESHYNLGIVLARLQDNTGAAKQYEKAIELGVSEPEAHLEYSKVLRTLGQDQQADEQLKIYQQAMKVNADREMAGSKSTDAAQAFAKGDAAKAVSLYREALEVTPRDASLQYKLALALDRTGDLQGERTALEQAVQIDPGLAFAQHQLGYLLYRSGDYDAAVEHFRLAVHADPGFTQAWISLSATLAAQSKFPESQEAVNHALKLQPQNGEALALKKQLIAAQAPR